MKTRVQTIKTKDKQDQNTIKMRDNTNECTNHKDRCRTRQEHNKNERQYKLGYKP